MRHVIKRRGHKEEFDERKVYASIYAACLAVNMQREEAENVAAQVSKVVESYVYSFEHTEISSTKIFHKASEELERLNKDASYIYTSHRDVS